MKCRKCSSELPPSRLAACPICMLLGDDDDETCELPADDSPRTLGQLELEEEIGRGGMGSVWRARHKGLDRTVAVKLLPEHLAKEPEFKQRFEREARALALLDHPNIVRVHDFGHEGDESYIVLELVEGSTLHAKIPLDAARALEVTSELLAALSYAHKRGVVHRDVKPANILLDEEGRVKVTDFGIARLVQGAETDWKVTASNVAVGTPGYLAPEALQGAPPDPRRDIYAVGVTLYEVTTGKLPLGTFEPPPKAVEPIVRRALASDPAKRYATADDMRADVEAARAALAGSATAGSADLPEDELTWMRIVAVVHAISAFLIFFAALECLRLKPDTPDKPPVVMAYSVQLANGMWRTYARFETLYVLPALATLIPSLAAYGVLRWHWRVAGLEKHTPERIVPASRAVLACGVLAMIVYGVRLAFEAAGHTWPGKAVIIPGAAIEFAMLYFFSLTILEAWRTRRSLAREWRAWVGATLSLIPPFTHMLADMTKGLPS